MNYISPISKTKHGTKVVFYTDGIQAEELRGDTPPANIGLVIWLPKARVDAALSSAKPEPDDATRSEAERRDEPLEDRTKTTEGGVG